MPLLFIFWGLGFFTATFDLVLNFEWHNFTIKSNQIFFLASFLSLGISRAKESRQFFKLPWSPWLILSVYAACLIPFCYLPIKSLAYTLWLLFDIFAIAFPLSFLSREHTKRLAQIIFATLGILASITVVDYVAYYFGAKDGWIGFNHDRLLHWGASRPHAFAFEPSYLAAFFAPMICFCFFSLYHPQSNRFSKPWLYLLFFLSLAALFATGSRTGWMATLLCLLLGGILLYRRLKIIPRTWIYMAGMAVVLLGSIYLLLPTAQKEMIHYRLISELYEKRDGPTSARLQSMRHGIAIAEHTNYRGTGLGSSYAYWVKHFEPQWQDLAAKNQGGEVVMSIWMQLFAELGIAGLTLFAGFAFLLLRKLWQLPYGFWRDYSLCTAAVFFLFTAHWLGNSARIDVWVWYAIWAAAARLDSGIAPQSA